MKLQKDTTSCWYFDIPFCKLLSCAVLMYKSKLETVPCDIRPLNLIDLVVDTLLHGMRIKVSDISYTKKKITNKSNK